MADGSSHQLFNDFKARYVRFNLSDEQIAALTWYVVSRLGTIRHNSHSEWVAAVDIAGAVLERPRDQRASSFGASLDGLDEICVKHKAHLQAQYAKPEKGSGMRR